MRRKLLAIGLAAMVLAVVALLWERRDSAGTDGIADSPPGAELPPGEQPTDSATAVSTGGADGTGGNDAPDGGGPLWAQVDESALAVLPPYAAEWSAEGRALVEVADTDRLWAVPVGAQIALPVPQLGTTYQSVVEEIDEGAGARALVGTITGSDGYRRRSVVTVGPASLFAFIDTPNGTYEFAIELDRHEHGWLVPTSSMLAGWDFSEPDYFVVGDEAFGGGGAP